MYSSDQINNKIKAQNSANDWIDCYIAAYPQYRNQICADFAKLLFVKAQSDEELNNKLNQIVGVIEMIRQAFETENNNPI